MSRTWCPAIDADASSLAVVVAAQPKSRRAASPSRDASHAAANVSVSASAHAADVIVHNTLVQQFDGRVALSEFARQRMVIPPNDVDATTVALRGSFREAVPTQLLEARSLHAACTAAKQVHAQRKQKSVIGLVQTTVTTAEVQKLIDDGEACSAIDGIAFNGSVRGANTLQVFFEALNRDPEAYRKFVLAKEAAEAARLAREAKPPAEDDEDQAFEEEADGESGPEPLPPIDLHLTTIQVAHAPTALSDNPTAAEELSKFVNATTTLKQLEIQRCSLQSSASLQALSTAILNNRSLTALDLSGNGVGRDEEAPASVEALAKLLQESKFLLDVSLRENDFSGPHCKALAEALANSDTRVPTPEPDPEPEAEPYTDDLGDPEEPPQVKIGFPEDEKPPEADPETAADEEKPEEVPAEAVEPTADANGETEAEEEEEEEAAAASPPQAPAVAETPVEEDDEEDEEKAAERQRLLEEKEEAERVAREEAEAAWRERMETFIWGPERLHLEYAEYTARRAVMQLHVTETTTMKDEEKRQRADAKGRQLTRQKLDRERRSGWSHLRSLDLSGNPVGSEGAIALASMLRTRIPLAVHHEDKGEAEDVEAAEPPPAAEEEEPAAPADDEDEENEKNVEEAAATAPADAPLPSTTAPAVKAPEPQFKLGMRTLKYINLNQCGIAAKGVVALANTIKDNADELRVLLLAKNKFALKHRVVQAVEEARESEAVEEEVDPDKPVPTRREVITDWASPAVAALSDCVAVNRALKVLDLSFNHLYPTAIRTLAKGLSGNQVLTTLRLDGNPIAHRNADGTLDHSGFDVLFEALATMRLANLGLAHTHLGAWLVESATGSAATKVLFGLTTLDLARNQITARALTVLNQAAASAEHCTLATLLLASNGFHHSDVQLATELSSLLKKLSRRLVTVDLSDNPNLGDNAIRSVAKEGLDDMPVLKRLLLRRTRLGPTTVVPLKKVIHSAMFLEELDFGDCLLDKESLESVMQSVCECTTLRRFTLWSRQLELGYAAATALLTKVPKLLLHVDLGLPQALGVEEPPEDTDEAYLVEDLEAVLLKNRQRASVPT